MRRLASWKAGSKVCIRSDWDGSVVGCLGWVGDGVGWGGGGLGLGLGWSGGGLGLGPRRVDGIFCL